MDKRNFLVCLDDKEGTTSFHLTLRDAGNALALARMNGHVLDMTTGQIVLGRGSGYFGIGTAMVLGLPLTGGNPFTEAAQ